MVRNKREKTLGNDSQGGGETDICDILWGTWWAYVATKKGVEFAKTLVLPAELEAAARDYAKVLTRETAMRRLDAANRAVNLTQLAVTAHETFYTLTDARESGALGDRPLAEARAAAVVTEKLGRVSATLHRALTMLATEQGGSQ